MHKLQLVYWYKNSSEPARNRTRLGSNHETLVE